MKDLFYLLPLFKPWWGRLLGGGVLAVLTALAAIALLGLSGWFICAAAVAGAMAPDGVAVTFNFMQPAAEIRALAIIRTLGRYGERWLTHDATFKVLAEIRYWFFSRLIRLTPGQLSGKHSGDVLSRITVDIDALDAIYLRIILPLAIVVIASALVLTRVYVYSAQLALILALALVVAVGVLPWLFSYLSEKSAQQDVEQNNRLKIALLDYLHGLDDILAYQAGERLKQSILATTKDLLTWQRRNQQFNALSSALLFLVAHLTLFAFLYLGARFVPQTLTGVQLALLIFVVLALFEWILPFNSAMQMLGKTRRSAQRIRHLAEMAPAISTPNPAPLPDDNSIQLQHIYFRYTDSGPWVLNKLDLFIPSAQKIAIIGQSGAGKTTLLHLLLRYFDPQHGTVSLGGVNYRQIEFDALMTRCAVLSQHSRLLSGSVRDNLRLAKPDARDAELTAALAAAGLGAWLPRLPDGLDSWLGEQGANVSGGEARRIALARVYLKNAAIVLLDEPCEGLDMETERDVLQRLETMMRRKTVIMVTHRTAGLDWMDVVYELKHGVLQKVRR